MSNEAGESALEWTYSDSQAIDVPTAKEMLREAKQIMDELDVVFFLRQGTCLGAVRDKDLIPWDDDLDLGSVIGLHGLSERSIDRVVVAFRDHGYSAELEPNDHYIYVKLMKSSVRLDWNCFRIIDGNIFHYPGIQLPIRLFTELKEIEFIGAKFLVPNPPEEYLRIKYGPSWMTPKRREWARGPQPILVGSPSTRTSRRPSRPPGTGTRHIRMAFRIVTYLAKYSYGSRRVNEDPLGGVRPGSRWTPSGWSLSYATGRRIETYGIVLGR